LIENFIQDPGIIVPLNLCL